MTERDRLTQRQRTQTQWSETGVAQGQDLGRARQERAQRKIARSEKQASKVKITERQLAQLEVVDKPWEGWRLQLSADADARAAATWWPASTAP